MGWFTKKNKHLENLVTKDSKILPLQISILQADGVAQPDKIGTFEELLEVYKNEIWVYSSVKQLMLAGASAPLQFLIKKDNKATKKEERVPLPNNHPLVKLFRKPNPHQCKFEFFEATLCYLELTGNCYWELVRNSSGTIVEMYVHSPVSVEIIPDVNTFIKGYSFNINGKTRILPVNDVIHFKYFDPTNIYYGLGSTAGANQSIAQDLYAIAYNKAFFKNSGIPTSVLVAPEYLDAEQRKQILAEWNKIHQGAKNSQKTGLLSGGMKLEVLNKTPKDADYIESRKMAREEMSSAHGVPPIKLGLYEFANQAGVREQRRIFWEDTMIPLFLRLEGVINTRIIEPNYGENISATFDTSKIQQLNESLLARTESASRVFTSSVLSRNEARELIGYQAVDGGEVFAQQLNTIFETLGTPKPAQSKIYQMLETPNRIKEIWSECTEEETKGVEKVFALLSNKNGNGTK